MFEGEALGLRAMYDTKSIRVPLPFKVEGFVSLYLDQNAANPLTNITIISSQKKQKKKKQSPYCLHESLKLKFCLIVL